MEIQVRWLCGGKAADVIIQDGGTTIEVGLLNYRDQRKLADHLREVADELDEGASEIPGLPDITPALDKLTIRK